MSNDDYEVGYGKPPKHTQFKENRSGNPKGRPKGSSNFGTDVKRALKAPVRLTKDGSPRTVSTQEAAWQQLTGEAAVHDETGLTLTDLKAWREIEGEAKDIRTEDNAGEKEMSDVE